MPAILNIVVVKRIDVTWKKTTVVKSLVISEVVHKAFYLPVHLLESFIKRINQVIYKFTRGSEWEKTGKSQLCWDITEVGAEMIDLKALLLSLKVKWCFSITSLCLNADPNLICILLRICVCKFNRLSFVLDHFRCNSQIITYRRILLNWFKATIRHVSRNTFFPH